MKSLASGLLCLIFLSPALAAEPAAIGYVDMQRVLEQSAMGKKANETLKEKFSSPQKELAEEEQAIRELQQKTGRDAALMSQAELDKRKGEIEQRVRELQQKAMATQQELARDQAELGKKIITPAQEVIAQLAQEKKLSAVFERNQSGLLYIQDSLELTDEVIKRLDAREKQ
jgi:outer membrane protein